MDLRNCIKCGRVFAYQGFEVCSRCLDDEEADFKKVKEYLYDYPGATVIEVSEETGVSEKKILRYLREGRIEIREEDNLLLDCERCGRAIRSGRFCDECIAKMQKEFTTALKPRQIRSDEPSKPKPSTKSKTDNKMYTAEIRKKLK